MLKRFQVPYTVSRNGKTQSDYEVVKAETAYQALLIVGGLGIGKGEYRFISESEVAELSMPDSSYVPPWLDEKERSS